jgi:hypothetical protein
MTSADQITDFKLRTDTYETPMGTFNYRGEATEQCKKADLSPECIKHTVEMSTVKSLLKAVNLHCGKLAEESDFSLSPTLLYGKYGKGKRGEDTLIPEKYWNLIAFAVEGQNEGYYIHIGALLRHDETTDTSEYMDLGVAKTYSSESAYAMAREAGRFLSAAAWN